MLPNPLTSKLGPVHHGAALHGDRRGHVALAHVTPDGWYERAVPVRDLPDVLPAVAGEADVYLSTQRFWGWRRIARLAECGALAVDLDYYRVPQLAGTHPLGILEDAVVVLERSRLPAPSLAISSGRGLYLLWLHGPVPRAALPRWNACQRELWRALRPLGADRGALDAARVLRVVGTRNSKNGVMAEALGPVGERWSFDDLAVEILPLDRAELHDLRVQRAARAAKSPSKPPRAAPEGYTAATLWEARLSDLQTLRRLRWFGELPPGQRDHWLFIAGCAMSWLAIPPILHRELLALAHDAGTWSDRESRSRLQAIFKRAHMAARGERVEWGGVAVDPRYRFTNQRIIEELVITPEEEREMLTLISSDERRRRDRSRKEAERRRAGVVPRAEYEAAAGDRIRGLVPKVAALREKGDTYREIARKLHISLRDVTKCVALYGGEAPPLGRSEGSGKSGEAPHPLDCVCLLCSVSAPKYVRVQDLR